MKVFLKYLTVCFLASCSFIHDSDPIIGFGLDISNDDQYILFTKYHSDDGSLYEYSIKDHSSKRLTTAENSIHRNGVYIPRSNEIIFIDYQFGLFDSSRVMLLDKNQNRIEEIFKYPNIMFIDAITPDTIYFVSTSDIFKNRNVGADIYRFNGSKVEKLTNENFFSFFDIEITSDNKNIFFSSRSSSMGVEKFSIRSRKIEEKKFPKGSSVFISSEASPVLSSDTSTMYLCDGYRINKWDLLLNKLDEVVPHREGRNFLEEQLSTPVVLSDHSKLYFTTPNSQDNGFIYCYESSIDTIFEVDLGVR